MTDSPLLQALYEGRRDDAERLVADGGDLDLFEASAIGDAEPAPGAARRRRRPERVRSGRLHAADARLLLQAPRRRAAAARPRRRRLPPCPERADPGAADPRGRGRRRVGGDRAHVARRRRGRERDTAGRLPRRRRGAHGRQRGARAAAYSSAARTDSGTSSHVGGLSPAMARADEARLRLASRCDGAAPSCGAAWPARPCWGLSPNMAAKDRFRARRRLRARRSAARAAPRP